MKVVLSKLYPKLLFQGENLFLKDRGILLWDRSLDFFVYVLSFSYFYLSR
jgi:hypothetical protein